MAGKTRIPTVGGPAAWVAPFAALNVEGRQEPVREPAVKAPAEEVPAKRPQILLRRETAHRGGKIVLVVERLPTHLAPEQLAALLRRLKASLGCGGILRGRALEIQGGQAGKLAAQLQREGYEVKQGW